MQWMLMEQQDQCNLVTPQATVPITSFSIGQAGNGDSCGSIQFKCIFDETPSDLKVLYSFFSVVCLNHSPDFKTFRNFVTTFAAETALV